MTLVNPLPLFALRCLYGAALHSEFQISPVTPTNLTGKEGGRQYDIAEDDA